MTLGLDFNGVLSKNPNAFRKLMKHFDKTVIISATKHPEQVRMSVKRLMIQAEVVTLDFDNIREIPYAKLAACRDNHVDIYIDDMEPVCTLLNRNNILCLRYG